MKDQLKRRLFMGAAGAGLTALPWRASRAVASERVRVAVIGPRNRGTDLARLFGSNPGAEIAALCDVDDAMFGKAVEALRMTPAAPPPVEKDFRRLLDDKTIDAVVVATPDHWHAMLTILACQDWGTGELGNNGIHGIDVGRWGLGVDAPVAVSSGGGKYVFDDDQETRDTQTTTWDFPGACITYAREYRKRFEVPSHV